MKMRIAEEKNITHHVDIHIHYDKMQIGNNFFTLRDDIFNVKLKANADGLTIINGNSFPKPIHDLRPRLNKLVTDIVQTHKPQTSTTVAKPQSKPLHRMIENAWRLCKNNHKQNGSNINLNDIVMAKLRGYTAWPAIVVKFMNKSQVKVEFFGVDQSQKIGFVNIKEITRFSDSAEVILLLLKRNIPNFKKSVHEAEIVCGIPGYVSILDLK